MWPLATAARHEINGFHQIARSDRFTDYAHRIFGAGQGKSLLSRQIKGCDVTGFIQRSSNIHACVFIPLEVDVQHREVRCKLLGKGNRFVEIAGWSYHLVPTALQGILGYKGLQAVIF